MDRTMTADLAQIAKYFGLEVAPLKALVDSVDGEVWPEHVETEFPQLTTPQAYELADELNAD
jgi:hypothetical protein